MASDELLPQPLPEDPLPLFRRWFNDARSRQMQPNPDSMALATVGANATPAVRIVLCKHINDNEGYVVFFTNYVSRKGRELSQYPRAAAVFHWDALHRQVRIEGPVLTSPPEESDRYFASRALQSRIGAWASEQSAPLDLREHLIKRAEEVAVRFGVALNAEEGEVPRPPQWGGYRLWIQSIELWSEGAHRIHDRARWTRDLQPQDKSGFACGPWRATRLNP